jgi:hypothetical protein
MTTLVKLRDTAAVHCFWKGNITFQSRFMSTTVQWLVAARSSATSRRPNPVLAHRVISLRCRILSLSGHSGHRSSRTNQARFMSTRPSLSLYDESQTTVKCVSLSADHTKQQLTSALGSEIGTAEGSNNGLSAKRPACSDQRRYVTSPGDRFSEQRPFL